MKNIVSCAVLGAALAAATGAANAEQPMTLSAGQLDQVTAGGFGFVQVELYVQKVKDVQEQVLKLVQKAVVVDVDVDGYLADAEAGANCYGFNCLAETLTITDSRADLFTATAFSESLSAATAIPLELLNGN